MRRLVAALLLASGWIYGAGAQSSFPVIADHYPSQLLIETYGTPRGVPPGIKVRPLELLAIDLIKDFENWVPMPYNDAVGNCTIGYGHLIAPKSCESSDLVRVDGGKFAKGLTQAEGLALLNEDTTIARVAVQELVTAGLDNNQFGALTSFVFNIGRANFAESTMLALLNARKYEAAADQFHRWVRGGNGVLPGLVTRRACELALYRGELTVAADGHIVRTVCKAPSVAPDFGSLIDIYKGEKK